MANSRLSRDILWSHLARERQMTSLMEKEIIPLVEPFTRKRENWVPMWVDLGNRVACETGAAFAVRAITDDGKLLWYVRQAGQSLGYHSMESDPVAAIAEARNARRQRRIVRERWGDVQQLRRDVLRGKERFTVQIEDAYASPLCTLGIDGFMRRIGMGHVARVPGRVAAGMMALDEQVGFVLWQAYQRHSATATQIAPPSDAMHAS